MIFKDNQNKVFSINKFVYLRIWRSELEVKLDLTKIQAELDVALITKSNKEYLPFIVDIKLSHELTLTRVSKRDM